MKSLTLCCRPRVFANDPQLELTQAFFPSHSQSPVASEPTCRQPHTGIKPVFRLNRSANSVPSTNLRVPIRHPTVTVRVKSVRFPGPTSKFKSGRVNTTTKLKFKKDVQDSSSTVVTKFTIVQVLRFQGSIFIFAYVPLVVIEEVRY